VNIAQYQYHSNPNICNGVNPNTFGWEANDGGPKAKRPLARHDEGEGSWEVVLSPVWDF